MEGNARDVRSARSACRTQLPVSQRGRRRVQRCVGTSGVGAKTGCYGFTAVASDFDNDGYPDIYVACDSTPSLLYHNRKNGTFEEIGIAAGVALNEDGQEQAGMGVAAADYDEDGHIDMIKTNFSDDVPNLYHNNGDGTFTDLVRRCGLSAHTQYLGWGILFADVDHDGRKDIVVINGHVYPEIDKAIFRPSTASRGCCTGTWGMVSLSISPPSPGPEYARRGLRAARPREIWITMVRSKSSINNLGARPSLLKNFGPSRTGCWCTRRVSSAIEMRSARECTFMWGAGGCPAKCRPDRASCRRTIRGCTSDLRMRRVRPHRSPMAARSAGALPGR